MDTWNSINSGLRLPNSRSIYAIQCNISNEWFSKLCNIHYLFYNDGKEIFMYYIYQNIKADIGQSIPANHGATSCIIVEDWWNKTKREIIINDHLIFRGQFHKTVINLSSWTFHRNMYFIIITCVNRMIMNIDWQQFQETGPLRYKINKILQYKVYFKKTPGSFPLAMAYNWMEIFI